MYIKSKITLPRNFNSIKVRLEPCKAVLPDLHQVRFQFHKGAIRTGCQQVR